MMYKILKTLLLTILFLNLTACNTLGERETNLTENKSQEVDLIQLKQETDEAYINDDLFTSEKGYEILVKKVPTVAENWFRLANIYVRTNRPASALGLYREAVIRDPKYSKAWYNMSIVQLKQTAYSLTEMLNYTSSDDPLYDKAKEMLDDIKSIIQQP